MVAIRGNHFTEEDLDRIIEEHPDAMERIKDVEEYRFVLNWYQLKQNRFCYCFVHSFYVQPTNCMFNVVERKTS